MNNTYPMIEQIKLLFVTKGYEDTSAQDIMQICRLKEADFANQLKSKDHAYCLVLDTIGQDIDDLIFYNYADQQITPEQKISVYIQSYMQHMMTVYPHVSQNSVLDKNKWHNSIIHYAYQRVEYKLSALLLEIMNIVLYGLDSVNLLGWNTDYLRQQIKQSNSLTLSRALDIQHNLYHSKIRVHGDNATIDTKRNKWLEIQQVEQEIMNTKERCTLVKTLLHCIEQYPIIMLDPVGVTEQRRYELH